MTDSSKRFMRTFRRKIGRLVKLSLQDTGHEEEVNARVKLRLDIEEMVLGKLGSVDRLAKYHEDHQ